MKIAVALFPGVEELDWAGPYEVLALWGRVWPADDVHVFTIAESQEPIACANGARVLPTLTWEDAPHIDVLVYPGGRGAVAQVGDERIRKRLRDLSASGTLMTSVCTGALVYADAGLLEGRAATTTGALWTTWPGSRASRCARRTASWTPEPSSRRRGCQRGSIWRFIL
jgi:putative intracellular protease/amidase